MEILLSGQLLMAALLLGAVYSLVAIGLNLIYGAMRLLNIAHGEVLMLGAYLAFWASSLLQIGPLWSVFVAMPGAALLGAFLYRYLLRGMLRSPSLQQRIEANSLLIFFGLSMILQNVAALVFTSDQRTYATGDKILNFGAVSIGSDRLLVLVIGLAATCLCIGFFRFTRYGIAVRAVIQQREAAALVGIDIDRTNRFVFSLGLAMAALAGVLIGMIEPISPFMGFPFTISAFVVIILGGLGNLSGGLIGALVLSLVEVYGVALTSSSYRSILVYGVFIAILLLRPQGLLGRASSA